MGKGIRAQIAELQAIKGKASWSDSDRLTIVSVLSQFFHVAQILNVCPEIGPEYLPDIAAGNMDEQQRAELVDIIDCHILPVLLRVERDEIYRIFPHQPEQLEQRRVPVVDVVFAVLMAVIVVAALWRRYQMTRG